jgi:hypothetical protein
LRILPGGASPYVSTACHVSWVLRPSQCLGVLPPAGTPLHAHALERAPVASASSMLMSNTSGAAAAPQSTPQSAQVHRPPAPGAPAPAGPDAGPEQAPLLLPAPGALPAAGAAPGESNMPPQSSEATRSQRPQGACARLQTERCQHYLRNDVTNFAEFETV